MISIALNKRVPFPVLTVQKIRNLVKKIDHNLSLPKEFQLSCVIVSNREIRRINRTYRKNDKITDVLSFRYSVTHGEIVLSAPRVRQQAKSNSHSVLSETKLLLIHGLLHLAGWDHERSQLEEQKMKRLENKLLQQCL